MIIREKLLQVPSYSQELGLDLTEEGDRFKWFLASILFAKRISSQIAKTTYKGFEMEGIVTSESIIEAGWDKLVEVLDGGGYVRYDFSTASNLLEIAASLKDRYGSLDGLYAQAKNSKDLEKRLLEFKGVGPTTINIFLRELKGIWEKAKPQLSPIAREVASKLRLSEEELEALGMESALVRIGLEFCKGRKCSVCPVREECSKSP
jgi:Predicted EndoIII-related endonuclease